MKATFTEDMTPWERAQWAARLLWPDADTDVAIDDLSAIAWERGATAIDMLRTIEHRRWFNAQLKKNPQGARAARKVMKRVNAAVKKMRRNKPP